MGLTRKEALVVIAYKGRASHEHADCMSNMPSAIWSCKGGGANAKDPAWGAYRVLYRTSQSCTRFCRKLRSEG